MAKKRELLIEESNVCFQLGSKGLSESKKIEHENDLMVLRNVPATILNEKNKNGRIYNTGMFTSALEQCTKGKMFESRRLLCSADGHPSNSNFVEPINASHVVIGAEVKKINGKDVLLNDWLILDTKNGRQLRSLVEARVSFGTSIRGLGNISESGNVDNYHYLGTDAVGSPSAGTYTEMFEAKVDCEYIPKDQGGKSVSESVEDESVEESAEENTPPEKDSSPRLLRDILLNARNTQENEVDEESDDSEDAEENDMSNKRRSRLLDQDDLDFDIEEDELFDEEDDLDEEEEIERILRARRSNSRRRGRVSRNDAISLYRENLRLNRELKEKLALLDAVLEDDSDDSDSEREEILYRLSGYLENRYAAGARVSESMLIELRNLLEKTEEDHQYKTVTKTAEGYVS